MVGFVAARVGWRRHGGDEGGQGLVEYALILVLISVVAIGIMTTIGGQVSGLFASVSAAL
jgi:pilus assembly protein Flp/PilA